jgi:hypothetical protein
MLVNLLKSGQVVQLRFLMNFFAAGDVVSIFNNTSGDITITCTIAEAYIAGVNTDETGNDVDLATRGICTILFISGTLCVISGNVS